MYQLIVNRFLVYPVQTSYVPKSDNSLKRYVFSQNSICQKQSVKNDHNKFHVKSLCNVFLLMCERFSPPLPPSVLILSGTFVSFHSLFNKWLLWYLRYTDAAIEWSLWVNSLPSQRKEFYTKWQQQQSDEQYVHMKKPLRTFCIFILLFNLNQVEIFKFPLCKVVFYYCSFRMVHRELQKIKCFNCILFKNLF